MATTSQMREPSSRRSRSFAELFEAAFVRVESVAKLDDGSLRILDLTDPAARAEVFGFSGGRSPLFISPSLRGRTSRGLVGRPERLFLFLPYAARGVRPQRPDAAMQPT